MVASMPPRPRTKPAEVRREELMAAAERIFVTKGVAATSIDEIVAAAGVAKGTFYIHYPSKEHLLGALQARFVVAWCNDFRAAVDRRRADDWKGKLRAWVEAGVNGYLDRLALHDVVFHEYRPEPARAAHEKHDDSITKHLAELLALGTRAGAWSVESPRMTAVMLFHALHGALDEAIGEAEAVNRKRLVRTLEAFFQRAVGLA
jgi:AcrR family transcriptional regulator